MTERRIFCPAKINLFLEVTGKRSDGYHELATLFAKLNFGDNINLRVSPSEKTEILFSITGPCAAAAPADENNLAYKAAARFFEFAGLTARCEIKLEKNIPAGAGLGGGSSDAGRLLAELCKVYNVDFKKVIPLAAKLGADVPLFLYEEPVLRAEGIGEILTPVPVKNNNFYAVLSYPGVHISTKEVFKRFRLAPPAEILTNTSKLDNIVNALSGGKPLNFWGGFLFNRLEDFVLPHVKEVRDLKKFMLARARCVMMSGSGSTVFALFDDKSDAIKLATEIRGAIVTQPEG